MKRDAELHADEDKQKREFADARVEAENQASSRSRRLLKEAGDKIGDGRQGRRSSGRSRRSRRRPRAPTWRRSETASGELDQAAQAMAQHLYSQQAGSRAARPGPRPRRSRKKGGDDVIDAEYEVKK